MEKRDKNELVEATERRHQSFVEMQNSCPLCNSQLTIRVESYLEGYTLREEATCTKCQVLARVKDHKMH
jgi:hypothetical protein